MSSSTIAQNEQADWDAIRLSILQDLSNLRPPEPLEDDYHSMLVALTDAYDQAVPVYSVYRQLRTFKVARWPLLRGLLQSPVSSTINVDSLGTVLRSVTAMAGHAAGASNQQRLNALEVDMAVLSQLLSQTAS